MPRSESTLCQACSEKIARPFNIGQKRAKEAELTRDFMPCTDVSTAPVVMPFLQWAPNGHHFAVLWQSTVDCRQHVGFFTPKGQLVSGQPLEAPYNPQTAASMAIWSPASYAIVIKMPTQEDPTSGLRHRIVKLDTSKPVDHDGTIGRPKSQFITSSRRS